MCSPSLYVLQAIGSRPHQYTRVQGAFATLRNALTDAFHWRALYNANFKTSCFAVRVIGTACISSIDPRVSRLATELAFACLIEDKVYFAVTSFVEDIFACAEVAACRHVRWLKRALLRCKINRIGLISRHRNQGQNNWLFQIQAFASQTCILTQYHQVTHLCSIVVKTLHSRQSSCTSSLYHSFCLRRCSHMFHPCIPFELHIRPDLSTL